ncbi:MAG: hypothetical protein ABL927_12725, partial [Bdellovibrionales bacterium]
MNFTYSKAIYNKIILMTSFLISAVGHASATTVNMPFRFPTQIQNQTQLQSQNMALEQDAEDAQDKIKIKLAKFEDAPNCSQDTDFRAENLSALTGLLVGPSRVENFNKLDKPLLRPFYSDGCSLSPDGMLFSKNSNVWVECCIKHDVTYWLGGTAAEKQKADKKLEKCIANKGYPEIGKYFKMAVETFGVPEREVTYRWGYGWNKIRLFSPISEDEKKQVLALYNVEPEQLLENLNDRGIPLINMCTTHDAALNKISLEEKNIYKMLNTTLHTDDTIEWAKWGYYDLDKREFEVKLMKCKRPIIITISKIKKNSYSISNNCD